MAQQAKTVIWLDNPPPQLPSSYDGTVKWYNARKGYGFLHSQAYGGDIFCHAEAFHKPLDKFPPAEGDIVNFCVHTTEKGPEAHDVHLKHRKTPPAPPRPRSKPIAGNAQDGQLRTHIFACIYAAQAIAGEDTRHLSSLVTLLLRHNHLPAIQVPPPGLHHTGACARTPAAREDALGEDEAEADEAA